MPFPCNWEGEVFWNSMAAWHPCVVDYYFRDGRERVERRANVLLGASGAASTPLTASDVGGHLAVLQAALNGDDPHYRYEFRVGAQVLAGQRSDRVRGSRGTLVAERRVPRDSRFPGALIRDSRPCQ